MTGPDHVLVDRFDVANAAFWLDMVAVWLQVPAHADQLAVDLWDTPTPLAAGGSGRPLTLIVGRAAAALRASLNPDTTDTVEGVR